jgi:SAM-dependent methyltransferase
MDDESVNLWGNENHATQYLARADTIPHRLEGEAALLEWIPNRPSRVLDLGSGDGRLLSLVVTACAPIDAVALDFSHAMLDQLRHRFSSTVGVSVVAHDLDEPPLEGLGTLPPSCRRVVEVKVDRGQGRARTLQPACCRERQQGQMSGSIRKRCCW